MTAERSDSQTNNQTEKNCSFYTSKSEEEKKNESSKNSDTLKRPCGMAQEHVPDICTCSQLLLVFLPSPLLRLRLDADLGHQSSDHLPNYDKPT